jgi:magnesium-protoporphyrin O-methyltransferase
MISTPYQQRRGELQTYFDRTAVEAWARLTSTAPVSKIRATVRAGREDMRETLLGMLPSAVRGRRVLDAGCGTGALGVAAAQRGAHVVCVDLSPTLIGLARDRLPSHLRFGRIEFHVGDMLDEGFGLFDHVIAMDSLIHYRLVDVVAAVVGLAARTRHSILFTFAPNTALLALMWSVGRLFPRKDRAPAIQPIREKALRRALAAEPALSHWHIGRTRRVDRGFYKSQALELVKT